EPPADPLRQRGEVVGVGDVELDDLGLGRELAGGALGEAHDAAERAQHHLRPLLLGEARDTEADRGVVEDAGDEDPLAVEEHQAGTSTSVALWPPNPNEFDRAGARSIDRGSPWTTSISGTSSPSRWWFAVGGTSPSRAAASAAIASSAPAAPMR